MTNRIPVTLLTGFLGAGKTTILNRLLKDPTAGRIAVIVNEFGDAGLDHDLIEDVAEDIVLMPAGCICCTIRGDLSKTLQSLFARRTDGTLTFDRVVIETTGLADPAPVHHTMLIEPELATHFALDGIVTAVDSVLGVTTINQHGEAQAQVAMADVLVLTKSDLVTDMDKRVLADKLDRINPRAKRIIATKGRVPAGALIGLNAFGGNSGPEQTMNWLAAPQPAPINDPLAGLSGFNTQKKQPVLELSAASHHATDDRISSASIIIDTPITVRIFDFWLDTLIALRGANILRVKGIVHLEDIPTPFLFHGVQHIFEPPEPLPNWPKDDTISRVVVIARDFAQHELEQSLAILKSHHIEDQKTDGITMHTLAAEAT